MALDLYETNGAPVKRELLDFLSLNTEFRGDTLRVTFKKPFDILAESIDAANSTGVAFDDSSDARQVWLPMLEAIRTFVVTPGEEERVQMQIYPVVFPGGAREASVG